MSLVRPFSVSEGEAPTRAEPPREDELPRTSVRSAQVATLALLGVAVLLWLVSLPRINVSALGSLGLLSDLPVTMLVAFVVLAASMAWAVHRRAANALCAAHVVVFVLMLHGTPALRYATLRYAWAWRHLGLVDEITRHHGIVAGSARDLGTYHYWPGFFATSASWLNTTGGVHAWTGLVQWAPPFFQLLSVLAVYTVLRALTDDSRVVWLGVWFFAIANWIGQDYFSPQALMFFVYLAVIATLLRVPTRLAGTPVKTFVIVGVCTAAIVSSHPLTPVVLVAAVCLLALVRLLPWRPIPLLVIALEVGWLLTGARPYVTSQGSALTSGFGDVSGNVGQSLSQTEHAASAQHAVSVIGRAEVVLIALIALVGLVRRWRRGNRDYAPLVLAIAPVAIVFGSSYGGEATFRVYLFALPFVAFFAAASIYPSSRDGGRAAAGVIAFVVSAALIFGTLFAYYGKEQWTSFSSREVRAADVLYANAQPGSVIVEGIDDYPSRFRLAGQVSYVTLATEPPKSVEPVLADPVPTLYSWLTTPRYRQGYLIITRSQKAEADALGVFPKGALDRIESALLASPQFEVLYHDRDASVFTVGRRNGGAP